MYERFTDRARKVMQLANQEARLLNHEYIGTEHILLGLAKAGDGAAVRVLKQLGLNLDMIRLEVEKLVQRGPDGVTTGRLPPTPPAKKVIECAIEEARRFGHNFVDTKHLLVGLISVQEGVAGQVLANCGVNLDMLRQRILSVIRIGSGETESIAVGLERSVVPDVEYFNAAIERLNEEKEEAVAEQNFLHAAQLRDQADRLMKLKSEFVEKMCKQTGSTQELPELRDIISAIDRVRQERTAAMERFDSEIAKLRAERARIVGEWIKHKLEKSKSSGEPGA